MSTTTRYEVDSMETLKTYPVNLENRTCSCGEWQAQGFPCAHAIRAILTRNENPQLYAEPFYALDAYKSTYAGAIMHPQTGELETPPQFDGNRYKLTQIADGEGDEEESGSRSGSGSESESESESESDDTLMPPNTRRLIGRPKKRRIRSHGEQPPRSFKCGRCEEIGHSRRTC